MQKSFLTYLILGSSLVAIQNAHADGSSIVFFNSSHVVPLSQTTKDPTFNSALSNNPNFVFSKQQTQKILNQLNTNTETIENRPVNNFSAISKNIDLVYGLKTSYKIPTIYLSPDNVTTLNFSDMAGSPWSISKVILGSNNYYVDGNSSNKNSSKSKNWGNIVTLSPKKNYSVDNNMVIVLKNQAVPIVFKLRTGGKYLYNRVSVTVQAMKPGDNVNSFGQTMPLSYTRIMNKFGEGLPPKHSEKLYSTSQDVTGYIYKHNMYIVSNLTLVGGYLSSSHVAGGVNVYRRTYFNTLTFGQNGQYTNVHFSKTPLQ